MPAPHLPDDARGPGRAFLRAPMPWHEPPRTGTFETRLGATIVWLLFLGLGLNIWPGWTRIAEWLPQT